MRYLFVFVGILLLSDIAFGQISAKLMRYMDISETKIVFVYGGDLWLAPIAGGSATQITHSPGEESYPRFSPDGNHIGYTASYGGNSDVYIIPSTGGIPHRVTYQSHADRMIDWHPDGDRILFASRRELGQRSSRQFFLVSSEGGLPEKLPIPYGELASFSPEGDKLAYITKITENYPFKRYRGGLTSDILLYDFKSNKIERITDHPANDGKPAWVGDKIYFLSDRGENMRLNIWSYDLHDEELKQITTFTDFDISYLSGSKKDLVFESGGDLYLMDAESEKFEEVMINVITDLSAEMPRKQDVSKNVVNATAAPEGKRIVFEARGELFNVPQKDGYTVNMTRSSGALDRDPAWSPDGKYIAYWSDASGENEIYLASSKDRSEVRRLTNRNKGYGYKLFWSPDSEKICFIDEENKIYIVDVETGSSTFVDHTNWNISHNGRPRFIISWSKDSKWITYSKGLDNANSAVFFYHLPDKNIHQVTSSFFDNMRPLFSDDGKYLFLLTNRRLSAAYSDLGDGTWIYPNATQVGVINLKKDYASILAPKNDTITIVEKEKDSEKEEESDSESQKKKDEKSNDDKEKNEKEEKKKESDFEIDLEDLESRLRVLPIEAGNINLIASVDGKLIFIRYPNTGSASRTTKLMYYDLKEKEEKSIMSGVQSAVMTADGKSILVRSQGKYGVIKPSPDQKIKDAIPTNGLVMDLIPREEWRQIFNDTWRRHRDFFYDPQMHGVDWEKMKERYGALIEDARTRWDVTNIQSNLVSELSAGHTYSGGGDQESVDFVQTGYLGIDWEMQNNLFRIKRIVRPARWDTEIRSPFDQPGVDVKEGYFIFSVNGVALDPLKDPYAAFEGLGGQTVSLLVGETEDKLLAKEIVIKCLSQGEETRLRYLEWIEQNRKKVDDLSGGQLGYVYMSNTSSRGQLELVQMFYGQLDKKGFVIDERFNGGGQLADRFLELMQRPVVYNLHWRHGRDHQYPIKTNTGPMGMLINGWAGSGGDGLPWAFQELKAGPIVGERTLGILVGPATGHRLIDGGYITVPGARLYDNDGHWFWEGEGVTPDIEVWDDPNILMQGRDPQLERVVTEVLELLTSDPPRSTPAPPLENRTADGLQKK